MTSTINHNDTIVIGYTPIPPTTPAGATVVKVLPMARVTSVRFDDQFDSGPAHERTFGTKVLGVIAIGIFSIIAVVFTIGWAAVVLTGSAIRRIRPRASRRNTRTL